MIGSFLGDRMHALRNLYRLARCSTMAQMGEEQACWAETHEEYPDDVSSVIQDLNRLGFVVDAACDGGDFQNMRRRPVVTGFATEEVKDWLDDALCHAVKNRFRLERDGEFGFLVWELFNPKGRHARARGVVSTRGRDGEILFRMPNQRGVREIRRSYWFYPRGWKALRSAWQVTIFGAYGSNDLWDTLRTVCQERMTMTPAGGPR